MVLHVVIGGRGVYYIAIGPKIDHAPGLHAIQATTREGLRMCSRGPCSQSVAESMASCSVETLAA